MKKIAELLMVILIGAGFVGCTSDAHVFKLKTNQIARNAILINTDERSGGDLSVNRNCGQNVTVRYTEESLQKLELNRLEKEEDRVSALMMNANAAEIKEFQKGCGYAKPYRDTLTDGFFTMGATVGSSAILGLSYPKLKGDNFNVSNDSEDQTTVGVGVSSTNNSDVTGVAPGAITNTAKGGTGGKIEKGAVTATGGAGGAAKVEKGAVASTVVNKPNVQGGKAVIEKGAVTATGGNPVAKVEGSGNSKAAAAADTKQISNQISKQIANPVATSTAKTGPSSSTSTTGPVDNDIGINLKQNQEQNSPWGRGH